MGAESQLLEAIAALDRYKNTNKLEYYQPYEFQKKFHNALGYQSLKPAAQRALMCANQIGKCVTGDQRIEHPDGSSTSARALYALQKPFDVISWDGEKTVPAKAIAPIKKPAEPCYRIYLSSGDWFECAADHRVLTSQGYDFVRSTLSSAVCLPAYGSVFYRAIRALGEWRYLKRVAGFLTCCLAGLGLYGGQLRGALNGVLDVVPSPIDALRRIAHLSRLGVLEGKYNGSLCGSLFRLSSLDAAPHLAGQSSGYLDCGGSKPFAPLDGSRREFLLPALESFVRALSGREAFRHRFVSLVSPKCANRIVAYEPIGAQDVYDFTVPEYGNYYSAGAVHHNTYCGGMEGAIHLTGKYPDWWKGYRFTRPISMLVGGLTNESVRDICQKELFGDPNDEKSMGTGAVPAKLIGKWTRKAGVPNALDTVMVKHVSGGWSKVSFRAYEQGAKKHMGSRIDLGWMDEEPPEDIWAQYVRGTIATRGILYMTFTPEEGITKVVYGFMNDLKPGQALIRATWDDAPHMNHERRDQVLAAIPAHQRDMRSKGIPLMGSGLVYQIPEEDIVCDPFEIPSYWPRICGTDFGIGHGFAADWLAWDRDRDIVYEIDCYKVEGEKMSEHVSQLNRRGNWIPVIWPHDGLNREKSSGEPLAEMYRKEGANMWHEKFSNPPAPGVQEGMGGNSVEYGIAEILNRMQTKRWKTFRTLTPVLEEQRMYHRVDGKIVKQFDDLMSARRYAALSLRHATTQTLKLRKVAPPVGARNW